MVGIALAVVVTLLILAGQIIFLNRSLRSGAFTSSVSPSMVPITGDITHRLQVAFAGALGPSDRGVRRFSVTHVRVDTSNQRLTDAVVVWAINDDLSEGTIGNEGQAEAYAMVRNVFTASLPVASLSLQGTFAVSGADGRKREKVVMKLSIDRSVAAAIQRVGWDGVEPGMLWPMLRRSYVDPTFEPLAPE